MLQCVFTVRLRGEVQPGGTSARGHCSWGELLTLPGTCGGRGLQDLLGSYWELKHMAGFSLHAAASAARWYWTSHFLFEAALFTSQCSRSDRWWKGHVSLSTCLSWNNTFRRWCSVGGFTLLLASAGPHLFGLNGLVFSWGASQIWSSVLWISPFIRLYSSLVLGEAWLTSCGCLVLAKAGLWSNATEHFEWAHADGADSITMSAPSPAALHAQWLVADCQVDVAQSISSSCSSHLKIVHPFLEKEMHIYSRRSIQEMTVKHSCFTAVSVSWYDFPISWRLRWTQNDCDYY